MFTKPEVQVITKTLIHRQEWLSKNLSNPEMATSKVQNQQTIELIESALAKLATLYKSTPDVISNTPAKPGKTSVATKRSLIEPKKIRVLVVDDDDLIAALMKAILQSVGIEKIDVATDGLKAISMLYDANPVYDLVLCDWNMPIKSGLDVHNAMRAAERYMETCFMLVTAVTEAKQIRSAIEEGVDDYVVKPIDEQKIISKIARHFQQIKLADN
jgi:two-component system chemotaxis response regulator CheY